MEKSKIEAFLSKLGDILEKPMTGLDKLVDRLPISQKSKNEFSIRKYGILGTLSFHLIILILFLGFRLNAERSPKVEGIVIDMKTLEELARLEMEVPEIPEKGEDNSRNIAVDQAEDRIESFEDYRNYERSEQIVQNLAESNVDQTVKDIIEEENLDPFNDELPDMQTEELKMYRADEIEEEEQVYTGATNIYFSLEGREVVNLDVPVYKCEGGGLIKLDIRVNRRGKVEFASVDTAESSKDDCLIKAAKNAAMKTRFNLNQAAPLLQSGSLTYRFIAQ